VKERAQGYPSHKKKREIMDIFHGLDITLLMGVIRTLASAFALKWFKNQNNEEILKKIKFNYKKIKTFIKKFQGIENGKNYPSSKGISLYKNLLKNFKTIIDKILNSKYSPKSLIILENFFQNKTVLMEIIKNSEKYKLMIKNILLSKDNEVKLMDNEKNNNKHDDSIKIQKKNKITSSKEWVHQNKESINFNLYESCLLIFLDKNYNIKHYDNPQDIFYSPIHYNNFQNWWHHLMDENIVNNNSFKDIMETITHQGNYLLATLNDECYSIGAFSDNDHIIIKFQEVTQEINTKSDLHNNYQLIGYLMESLNSPMIVFNKNQKIEFINEKTKEIMGPLNDYSIQDLSVLLKKNYIFNGANEWIIENNYYQLKTKIIGNFVCWIFVIKENPEEKEAVKVLKNTINNNNVLMDNISKNFNNENQIYTLKTISHGMINCINKYQYINGKNQGECSIKSVIKSLNTHWVNNQKIIIIDKINGDFQITNNRLKNIINWILDDVDKLCKSITIEFITMENKVYINIKLLGTPSYWSQYQNQLMDYIHKNYNYMINKNGGTFHSSIKNYQPIFQMVFRISNYNNSHQFLEG
jgi:hypothetical protein